MLSALLLLLVVMRLLLLLLLLPSTEPPSLGDGVAGCSVAAKPTGAGEGVTKATVGRRVLAGSGASERGDGVAAVGIDETGIRRRVAVVAVAGQQVCVWGERYGWDTYTRKKKKASDDRIHRLV